MKRNLNIIIMNEDAYMHLVSLGFSQRLGKEISNTIVNKRREHFKRMNPSGYITLYDYDLGGAENGKWTEWNVEKMAKLLDEAGFSYTIGNTETVFDL